MKVYHIVGSGETSIYVRAQNARIAMQKCLAHQPGESIFNSENSWFSMDTLTETAQYDLEVGSHESLWIDFKDYDQPQRPPEQLIRCELIDDTGYLRMILFQRHEENGALSIKDIAEIENKNYERTATKILTYWVEHEELDVSTIHVPWSYDLGRARSVKSKIKKMLDGRHE